MDLEKLALADLVGRAADDARGKLGIEAGTEMEAVADEVIAEEHRRLVPAEVVDGGPLAAKLGFVQHVVVNERGHVDHLDDGRQNDVSVLELSAGLAGEEHEHGAEHFSAESADVPHERVHAGDIAL